MDPLHLKILVPRDETGPTVPTIRVGKLKYHVVLTDFEVGYDIELTSAEVAAIVTYWVQPGLECWPADEKYTAELRRRFATLQMPRRLAVGYGAARGLLGTIPVAAARKLGGYWRQFAAEVMHVMS
jgi:hypothetical protein